MTLGLSSLYTTTGTAKIADLASFEDSLRPDVSLDGNHILTDPGRIRLYLP